MRWFLIFLLGLIGVGILVGGNHGQVGREVVIDREIGFTVALIIEDDGKKFSKCSGVWISSDQILTARHCVGEVGSLQEYKNSDGGMGMGIVSHRSSDQDLAIVHGMMIGNHGIAEIYRGRIWVGMDVDVVGHPAGMRNSYIGGKVSAIRENLWGTGNWYIQISGLGFFGNSGGGAYDVNGKLLGICSAMHAAAPGMMFFVHRTAIDNFLDLNGIELIKKMKPMSGRVSQ